MLGLHNFDAAISSVCSVFHKSKKKNQMKVALLYIMLNLCRNFELASILVKLFCHFST